uniref:Uncharacterized protein n=1 Tax=Stegastes partitus TaxID=144197 RepID=A0A3B4ZFE5_9TELE
GGKKTKNRQNQAQRRWPSRCATYELRSAALEDKANNMEGQQRRQNLRLYKLREEEGKNIKKIVTDICRQVAPEIDGRLVDVCQRVGSKESGRTRHVIIQFLSRADRDTIWRSWRESELHKSKGMRFGEDFTNKDRETRAFIRSRAKWMEQGEKNTSYVFSLEKRNISRNNIKAVNVDGHLTKNFHEISNHVTGFYKRLYESQYNMEKCHHFIIILNNLQATFQISIKICVIVS